MPRSPRLGNYIDSVKDGLVFFLRPHRELLAEDGVRAGVAWEEVVRIDGMVKLMLEMFAIPYIPVDCLPMQERVRLLERVFSLAGLEPARGELVPHDAGALRRLRESNGDLATKASGASNGNGARHEPSRGH